jgi:hypothetical protein
MGARFEGAAPGVTVQGLDEDRGPALLGLRRKLRDLRLAERLALAPAAGV